MDESNVINVFIQIFSWYHLLLVLVSAILNPFVFFMCLKSKKLRSISTFKLLAVSSINDMLCCLEWNVADFTNVVMNFVPSLRSLLYCRLVTYFMQYTTIEFESWMLVTISLDRFLSMTWKQWSKDYFGGKRPYIYAAILAIVLIAINSIEIFTIGYVYISNGTEFVVCSENRSDSIQWNRIISQVHYFILKKPRYKYKFRHILHGLLLILIFNKYFCNILFLKALIFQDRYP